jgi:spore coat protein JB
MLKQMPKEFYQMMEELQQTDFVLVELQLYLDTHPDDANAIQQFNQFSMKRRMIKEQFEAQFGPLQGFGNSYSGYPWGWNDEPWPWQV